MYNPVAKHARKYSRGAGKHGKQNKALRVAYKQKLKKNYEYLADQ